MSRIFDALQRSGAEQSGVEYPDMMSVAAAVFEPEREPQAMDQNISVAIEELPLESQSVPAKRDAIPEVSQEDTGVATLSFPSLEAGNVPGGRLVFLTQPESLAAEKFRFLSVRLRQIRQNRPLKKVLVTSTIPEEGKSVITANLAGALARRNERVLLIEGDLRRPVLADRLGLGTLAGLSEWLQSGARTPSNVYHLNGPGFWIMPAGHPPLNTLELMQSGRLSSLFQQITDSFDWIIVDSPPLLPLADTTVWTRLTDGTLLVAREGTTQKGPLQRGLEMIKKADLLGVVLNGCTDIDHKYYYRRYSPPTSK
jgi:capsular exopolysaccharide synthesis family protein